MRRRKRAIRAVALLTQQMKSRIKAKYHRFNTLPSEWSG